MYAHIWGNYLLHCTYILILIDIGYTHNVYLLVVRGQYASGWSLFPTTTAAGWCCVDVR